MAPSDLSVEGGVSSGITGRQGAVVSGLSGEFGGSGDPARTRLWRARSFSSQYLLSALHTSLALA